MTSARARPRARRHGARRGRTRVAFLIPTFSGYYWHSLLAELTRRHPDTIVFTALPWKNVRGTAPRVQWIGHRGDENAFRVEVVGRIRRMALGRSAEGYAPMFLRVPVLPLAARLVRLRPRIVFTSMFSMWSIVAVLLRPLMRARVVLLWEGSTEGVDARGSRPRTAWRRFIARRCDGVITNTRAGRDYLVDHLRVPADRVRRELYYVWPAPDLVRIRRTDDEDRPVRFVTVGHLTPRKGVAYLLRAAALLLDRCEGRFRLSVVGTGPDLESLKRLAAQAELGDFVEWHGGVAHQELRDRLAEADVFVFPSLEDTLGVAPLEAMAAGMPVICSTHAGAAEYVTDDVGHVVDPRDVRSLAESLAWFVDNRERVASMGERARQAICSHTPARAVTALEEVAYRRSPRPSQPTGR